MTLLPHAAYSLRRRTKETRVLFSLYMFIYSNCYVDLCPATTCVLFLFQPMNLLFSSSVILGYWKQRVNSNIYIYILYIYIFFIYIFIYIYF